MAKVPPFESAFAGRLMPKPLIELGFDIYQVGHDGECIAHSAMRLKLDDQEFRYRFVDELFACDPQQVHLRDLFQNTPLHLAAGVTVEINKLLVEKYGADLRARNKFGRIPLIWAVVDGKTEIVDYLCACMKERDVDIDIPDAAGWTALHWASFLGLNAIVRTLLEFGADCNKTNLVGRTPLHLVGYAFSDGARTRDPFSFGDHDITRVLTVPSFPAMPEEGQESFQGLKDLIDRGADATKADNDGNLAFFMAARAHHVPEAYLMIRAAASRGLFVPSEKSKVPTRKRKASASATPKITKRKLRNRRKGQS
eukprot:scaffold2050_cov167-Amphora_coffeaeformis.AAC.7